MRKISTDRLPGRKRNRAVKDYSGECYGQLTAVRLIERSETREHKWLFSCSCGGEVVTSIKSVRSGHTSSCGCLHRRQLADRNKTHGLSKRHPREYRSWKDMRSRCFRPQSKDYKDYGGRGISVCERWESFALFILDMGSKPRETTIDRIDVNGNYEPSNCRWATANVQANNKRSNCCIKIGSETKTLQQWSDFYGIRRETARWRLNRGWPIEKVFGSRDFRRSE